MTNTSTTMKARMAEHHRLTVQLTMAMAITAREVNHETTMAKTTTACIVVEVEISKTRFITGAPATAAGVKADFNRRDGLMAR